MTIHAFTSFSFAYLDRARVLARSIRLLHPEWTLWAIVVDRPPPGLAADWRGDDFDTVLTADALLGDDAARWLFRHDVVEACTAIKGRALDYLLRQPGVTQALYFDPDIALFNRMDAAIERLAASSIILTPHLTAPEARADHQAILDNEAGALAHGVFNLGFIGVANNPEGQSFAAWWRDRLDEWCYDRRDLGLFVDQKWCNLIPCFFDGCTVLRDPGYNVASWNLSRRNVAIDGDGRLMVNGVSPLAFYHFTKFGPTGAAMTGRYAAGNSAIRDLWWWYGRALAAAAPEPACAGYWAFGQFACGTPITAAQRLSYRAAPALQEALPDPFAASAATFMAASRRHA